MNRYDFYKELYFKEIERRGQLNNDISIPIGLATVLATAIFYYFTTYSFTPFELIQIIFTIMLITGTITLGIAIYYIIQSYTFFGRNIPYDYIALPSDAENYFNDYLSYQIQLGKADNDAKLEANIVFENYLLEAYVRTTSKNTSTNDQRAFDLYMSKKYIIVSFIVLLFTFIPFATYLFSKPDKPQKVEITAINNPSFAKDSLLIINLIKQYKMTDEKPTPPPTQTTPPSPPTPPADRQINEGEKPHTTKGSSSS